MPLPKPTYRIYQAKIPSTGKTVRFRPFTVREEKSLIIAQESEDVDTISSAILDVLRDCLQDNVEPDTFSVFDIEYLMTQIRAKSVGEVVNLLMPCENDATHEKIPVRIDLSKIEVTFPENHNKTISLYEDVGVVMKYPTLEMLKLMEDADSFEIARLCTDYVYDAEEIYPAADETPSELREFFESLEQSQFAKVEDFFKTMPVYQHILDYKCQTCGHNHKRIIKGLSNFFV
jgi:hypothetical protein